MFKRAVLTSFILTAIFLSNSFADPGDTLWTAKCGFGSITWAHYVQQTSCGGYLIACAGLDRDSESECVYIAKIDPKGKTVWSDQFTDSRWHRVTSVRQTADGGFIVAGSTGNADAIYVDCFLTKTDPDGSVQWFKTYGNNENEQAASVRQTIDGGFILTGSTGNFNRSVSEIYLVKTDSIGNTIWRKIYSNGRYLTAVDVQQTRGGGFIVVGNGLYNDNPASNIRLLKTNAEGALIWENDYRKITINRAYSVNQTEDGGYIVAGEIRGSDGYPPSGYLIKTDYNGNLLWDKKINYGYANALYSARETLDRGYIVAGSIRRDRQSLNDFLLIRTDHNGDTLWTRSYDGSNDDVAYNLRPSDNYNYVAIGTSCPLAANDIDLWLVKFEDDVLSDKYKRYYKFWTAPAVIPNPFCASSSFDYYIPYDSHVNVSLYDIMGQKVAELVNCEQKAGSHSIAINRPLQAGTYFYKLTFCDTTLVQKLTILK